MKSIHFISGLPRSGSTLLANILRQNFEIESGTTTPVEMMLSAVMRAQAGSPEYNVFLDDERRKAVLRGIVEGYYHDTPKHVTVIDTNRAWCARLPLIAELYPEAKVICCVRNMAWIYDSLERMAQLNMLHPSRMFPAGTTVSDRFEVFRRSDGIVGFAWNALRQAFFSDYADRLMILTYSSLVNDPQRALRAVYEHLGMANYEHDLENVVNDKIANSSEDFDKALGVSELHDVRYGISANVRHSILPPDLVARVASDNFWTGENPRNVTIV